MCVEILIDGDYCDCVKDLRDKGLQIVPLNAREPNDDFSDTECLCSVNCELTAKANGFKCREVHMMEYVFEPCGVEVSE